ncbi:MAG: uroporphyrinogen decarboxylase family protein [Kiritimatiellales bacterium]
MKFFPAVYEHAAKVIGRTPWEVSRSKALMVNAHRAAFELYHHTPVVVGIDIYNLEAEAYGAEIAEPDGAGIPSFKTHLCKDAAAILEIPEFDAGRSGRLRLVIDAAQELKAQLPAAVVKVPVSGPFSLAANLCGLENLLCDALTEPETVEAVLKKLTAGQLRFCKAVADAGVGITFFESAATPPLVPPYMFQQLVLPALRELIEGAAEFLGETVPCIIGGNTAPILEEMLSTGTQYVICPGETDQAAFMEKMKQHPDVMVRINMNPAVFCSGSPVAALKEADRVMVLAKGREKVCLGSGVLPYEAVPETVLNVMKYVNGKDA